MQQHYELGQYLRRRYKDLLPSVYNVDDIYVRSSDVDRALQSATWNLLGLYPPTVENTDQHFQFVPIHTAPIEQDKKIARIPSTTDVSGISLRQAMQAVFAQTVS
ncbi:hypothetical protein PR048_011506 [Dryococelus australis]|uniref:2-phosphoxylose phosphatase 1 n=1 Tax=Dryococelus australis TaxID=614101 RepID=A0ABQ9HMD7_9NEOP|nr:hypothetical protein PR048_011506 [Dryococelus australis]